MRVPAGVLGGPVDGRELLGADADTRGARAQSTEGGGACGSDHGHPSGSREGHDVRVRPPAPRSRYAGCERAVPQVHRLHTAGPQNDHTTDGHCSGMATADLTEALMPGVEPGLERGDDGHRPAVDVVVPVYNEEVDLGPSIRRLHAYLSERFPFSWRITIADNASKDATPL